MLSNKFYAIKKGKKEGIFTSWEEAKQQIAEISGAKYKSFKTREEAEAYLNAPPANLEDTPILDAQTVVAYVDGSFDRSKGVYGSGIVMLDHEGNVLDKMTHASNNPKYVDSFQIAGETEASIHAIQWAGREGYKRVVIHFDYQGIASWAKGEWATKSDVAKAYKAMYDKLAAHIEVVFVKVKAHSDAKDLHQTWNDEADKLAKSAVEKYVIA